jgi:hypothetical protein
MAATTKLVNGVSVPLTADDIAEMAAMEEAADLDLQLVRGDRNSYLARTDWTQLGDAALGDHTPEEWVTYRQSLRDLPAAYSRVSEVVWPNDPPTQVVVDAEEAARLAAE